MTNRSYLVLDAGPDDDFFDLMNERLSGPNDTGMIFFPSDVVTPSRGVVRSIFMESTGTARIVLTVDQDIPVHYLTIKADDPSAVPQLTEALKGWLPTLSAEQLRDAAQSHPAGAPGLLVRMALGAAHVADPVSLDLLEAGLVSPDRDTRLDAIEAASLTQWPEVQEPLGRSAAEDPDPELRDFAVEALRTLQTALRR